MPRKGGGGLRLRIGDRVNDGLAEQLHARAEALQQQLAQERAQEHARRASLIAAAGARSRNQDKQKAPGTGIPEGLHHDETPLAGPGGCTCKCA